MIDIPEAMFYFQMKTLVVEPLESMPKNVIVLNRKKSLRVKNFRFEINKDTSTVYISRPDYYEESINTWFIIINCIQGHLRDIKVPFESYKRRVIRNGKEYEWPDVLLINQLYVKGIEGLLT